MLSDRGVQFPDPRQEDNVPIYTPAPNIPPEVEVKELQAVPLEDFAPATKVDDALPERELSMPENRVAKDAAGIFIEMLSVTEPGEDLKRNELLQELLRTIRVAHANNLGRLQGAAEEDWAMDELLHLNEILMQTLS
jgi:hypothetical protein